MNKKLRVGFVSVDDATLESTWSGTPLSILKRLRSHPDVDVELISPLKTTMKWVFLPFKLREKFTREHFIWYLQPLSLRYFAKQVETVFRAKKLDVVFSTSSIPCTLLNSSVPLVFWTDAVWHGMEGYYPGLFSNLSEKTKRTGRAQEQTSISRADFACYSSEWAASFARRMAPPERVKVLPYGPNLSIEHKSSDVSQWIGERRRARPNGCIVLFTGKDWERKGGKVAVETVRLLNEAGISSILRVVGCEPPHPLPSFVEVLGFIDKNEPAEYRRLVDIYRTSDIFILPSRAEASAIVLAEAAAFGLPVLTCDTGGLADYVLNDVNGYRLPIEDEGCGFATRAALILKNYGKFADGAFKQFETRLNWDISVNYLVALLNIAVETQRDSWSAN